MAPKARPPKKKADKGVERLAADGAAGSSRLWIAALVGIFAVGYGVVAMYSVSSSEPAGDVGAGNVDDGLSLLVRFRDAGSPDRIKYEVNTTFTKTDFDRHVKASSLYDARDGKELRTWADVSKVAAKIKDRELVLLRGPRRDKPSIRNFMWPAGDLGQRFAVSDVPRYSSRAPKIELEPLSVNPRVFYVHNFMSPEEADKLVARATDKSNPYSIRPSTVGHQAWNQGAGKDATNPTRTSENAFDLDSPTARKIKDRAWKLLRLSGKYDESMVDGIQVLRYKLKQAYIPHMDAFDVNQSPDHNWNPAKGGTNRFATLLLYLSDVDEGGQTVFKYANNVPDPKAVPDHAASLFQKGSWELDMVRDCYSKLAPQAKKGSAVLFYSQDERGAMNHKATHGGCPVLNGTKWAANLWFWNQCRFSQCRPWHADNVEGLKPAAGQV